MSSKRTRLIRLLERGFYPAELPPPFQTRGFSQISNLFQPNDRYSGSTLFYEGGTFRGQLRKFGIINPINFFLLARYLAENWSAIRQVYRLSSSTGSRPTFPALNSSGRAIQVASINEKRKNQQHLASSFPIILALDINQFYGSIYTHSIPWAVLGKQAAKRLHRQQTLQGHWSDQLDRLVRNCNQRQTVGLPIGPDTSRIVSELILSRIDTEIVAKGTGIVSSQVYHNIDDYQIGVVDLASAEEAQSRFVRIITQYELRLNDFKTSMGHGMDFAPSNFQRHFDILDACLPDNFVEHFFEILYAQTTLNPAANVLGYALRRFAPELTANPKELMVQQYLQRLTFANPHQARWILPLLLWIYHKNGASTEAKRLFVWGIETCARRNDIGNLLWFLYGIIFLKIKLNRILCDLCFDLSSELVDLMLFHGKELHLFNPALNKIRERYRDADFASPGWLPLYEIGRRGWDSSSAFRKFGGPDDEDDLYNNLKQHNVEFYLTEDKVFGVEAFEDWKFYRSIKDTQEMGREDYGKLSYFDQLAEESAEIESGLVF